MFGISFSEIILILVISLIIFGPEQLPIIARKAGKVVATFREMSSNIRSQLYETTGIEQFNNLKTEFQQQIDQIKNQFRIETPLIQINDLQNEEFDYQEFYFLYQPELDFNREPELFDE
ncbi:Sec-independent protein translocase protein TatB [Aquella oligotrophica]|uniref:Twin-arginine translocase subunit TatB n=1 Tax=Aquella oligotrophica TaxID=2067065 RepID=A0A2I7N5R4_9NEIS|nr:Sec-independent protein translocase protein TatB [Aquella oligotrophica]AUR51565.1 twin-arginine translocase subunit TatB [Aquella oligotrophica]